MCSESEQVSDFILDLFLFAAARPQRSMPSLCPDPEQALPAPYGVCSPTEMGLVWAPGGAAGQYWFEVYGLGTVGSVLNLLKLSSSKWFLEQQFWLSGSSELTK